MGMRFAKVETRLNELERARVIYNHLAQYCNPVTYAQTFWKTWEDFEMRQGNKDDYQDFLRAKRQQELRYSVLNTVEEDQSQLQIADD